MDYTKYRAYMKEFFERLYASYSEGSGAGVMLPFGDEGREMWADGAEEDEEWKKWKLVPASISGEEIAAFEDEIGTKLPLCVRAFLTTYHHCFEPPVGRNPTFAHFEGMREAWNPTLVAAGYLPVAWDEEGGYIRCVDLANMPDEERCGVFEIDHEILFSLDENAGRGAIEAEMRPVAENFVAFLDGIAGGEI